MNTTQLECFVTVADTLNFAMAARQLNLTQPAVTQQIHSLEDELGTRLFNRTTRSVTLTQEGILFLNDAKTVLMITGRAKMKFSKKDGVPERQVFGLGFHTYGEVSRTCAALRRLREEFPSIFPLFRVVPFQHLFRLLDDNQAEAVMSFRDTHQKHSGRQYVEFSQLPITAVLSRSHPLAARQSLQLRDLSDYNLILIDTQKCPFELSQINYQLTEERTPSEVYFCESVESALTLAKAEFGIAVFPDIRAWNEPEMRSIPLSDIPLLSYGAYYKTLKGNPVLKRFLELSKEEWKDTAGRQPEQK